MFALPFEVKPSSFKIGIRDEIVMMGSCFTENMGEKFANHKFRVLANPFGVIYNPASIFKLIRQAIDAAIDPDNIIENGGICYHWDMHSAISATNREDLTALIIKQQEVTRAALIKARVLIITPGTSFVYHYKDQNLLVANCHKIPQKLFSKSLLSAADIRNSYLEMIKILRAVNPELHVILTISPVRHVKDGLIENNLSKSILIQAIQEIIRDDENSSYFPSYEIVIDVLRDYRFFKDDLVHPNEQATDYLWKQFINTYFDADTQAFIKEWEVIRKAMNHRPFHPDTPSHQDFLKKTINRLSVLKGKADISDELNMLKSQLL